MLANEMQMENWMVAWYRKKDSPHIKKGQAIFMEK